MTPLHPQVTALKEGVQRFGVGNWQKIVNDYPVLRQRTGVQLKDKVGAVLCCAVLCCAVLWGCRQGTAAAAAGGHRAAQAGK